MRRLYYHIGRFTRRTWLWDGFVPGSEFTIRITAATIEELAPAGFLFSQIAVTLFFRASDPEADRLDELAFGIVGAGQEFSVPSFFDDHLCMTKGAGLISNLAFRDFDVSRLILGEFSGDFAFGVV